eukprot:gene22962-31269_t
MQLIPSIKKFGICKVCGRSFDWRKKWHKVWDEVKYCSEKCRRNRSSLKPMNLEANSDNWKLIPRLMNQEKSVASKAFLTSGIILSAMLAENKYSGAGTAAFASYYDNRPTVDEVQAVFSPEYGWPSDVDCQAYEGSGASTGFSRLDDSPDILFYKDPRFVEHIDQDAVAALTEFHGQQLKQLSKEFHDDKVRVLDLCSSWVSHIPPGAPVSAVSGLGMNAEELRRNPLLSDRVVLDLNTGSEVMLPFQTEEFHAVLLQLSIDYLTYPVNVLREVARILKPNGLLIISFSNRVFIDKAVSLWTGKSDLDHIETVGSYLVCASSSVKTANAVTTKEKKLSFDIASIRSYDVYYEVLPARSRGSYRNDHKDPLYAVSARKGQ